MSTYGTTKLQRAVDAEAKRINELDTTPLVCEPIEVTDEQREAYKTALRAALAEPNAFDFLF